MTEPALRRSPWIVRSMMLAAAVVSGGLPAQARVQEYQVVRLLTYKTSCQIETLEDQSLPTGPMRFHARFENVSFYPDGIEIVCADRDDDRSCAVETKERAFDNLHLLTQPK